MVPLRYRKLVYRNGISLLHTLEQLRSGDLAGIRRLDLSCSLQTLPPEVFALADTLEVLNLSGNNLRDLPHDLPRLHKLKVIFCSNNPFTRLPEVLGDCPQLQVVGFKACRIAEVPDSALPSGLRWLILTDNTISALPQTLGERPALQKLMLAGNRLQSLPESLVQAQRLELLRLSANQLSTVPDWLLQLPRLSWLALSGNPLGWHFQPPEALPSIAWDDLALDGLLGEGASGHIYRARHRSYPQGLALKLFKGTMTSDGSPEHELAACLAAGQHPTLCTPSATLVSHPQAAHGLLLPLIPAEFVNLAGPPSLESCTRDVYPEGMRMAPSIALRVARQIAEAVAHLHARGVVHGDLYGHNILWNPTNGQALLSDFGAATQLPADDNLQSVALQALEVRAFGCLLDELLALIEPTATPAVTSQRLTALVQACMDVVPAKRPTMADVAQALMSL
jgi:hypothetical protein